MVHHPLDHDVCMVINASDYDDTLHEMWIEPVPATGGLKVARGARGLWFVKRDGEAVTAGYKTETEANAACSEMSA